jgi:ArsR family transcriptional regulator
MTPVTATSARVPKLASLEAVFRALADQTRLRILALLAGGEVCVCDIHETLGIPQPKASRHLAYLRRAGLVADRKAGLWVHYRLAEPSDPVIRTVLEGTLHCLGHVPGVKTTTPEPARRRLPVFSCCVKS